MSYRWLGMFGGKSQADGFFVDDQNQVLFWPTKNSPGYIIDPELADKIISDRPMTKMSAAQFQRLSLFLTIAVIALAAGLGELGFDVFSKYFSKWEYFVGSIAFFAILFISSIIFPVLILIDKQQERNSSLLELLEGCERIHKKKPVAELLKPSVDIRGTNPLVYRLIFLAAGLLGFFAISTGLEKELIGDKVIFVGFGLMMTIFFIFIAWFEVTGVSVKDVRLYRAGKSD